MRLLGARVHNNLDQSTKRPGPECLRFVIPGLRAGDDAGDIGILAFFPGWPVLPIQRPLCAPLGFFLRTIAPGLLAIALIDRRSAVRTHDQ